MEAIDYGGWLTEDLEAHYKEIIKERERSELFTERAEINKRAILVMTEILKRKKSE